MNARVTTRALIALGLLTALLVVSLAGRLSGIGAEGVRAQPRPHRIDDQPVTRAQKPRPAVVVLVVVVAVIAIGLLAAATAHAYWSSTGSATGTGSTGSVVALTTTASTPSGATLVPGGSAPLVLTVANPNPMAVVVGSVHLDPTRTVTVSGSVGSCAAPPTSCVAA